MNASLVAILCHLVLLPVGAPVKDCSEQVVVTSEQDDRFNFFSCMTMTPAPLADWKEKHPIFRSDLYTVEGWKCVPDAHYRPKDRV